MNTRSIYILLTSVLFLVMGCHSKNESSTSSPKNDETVKPSQSNPSAQSAAYLIQDSIFLGIHIGTAIASLPNKKIKKATLETGEGTFQVYDIISDKGEKLGNFLPDPLDKKRVGDIMITSPLAATKEGFKIGTTFQTLDSKLKNIEVHGSEIESKTTVFHGNLGLQLDYPSATYDLDKNEIPKDSKVTQIWIRRKINTNPY